MKTLAPITLGWATLYYGDSRDLLPSLEPEQFTACVCDPPYHLTQASHRTRLGSKGFMGKTWDGGDVAFRPEFWAGVLRVLKPGAMLLAFGGTRTFHRLTCAIEDAGFEIRDCLMWLYGSGFPKSLDISKALDRDACRAELTERLGRKPTKKEFKVAWEGLRNVIGRRKHPTLKDTDKLEEQANAAHGGNPWAREWDITAPTTDLAKRWNGWGSSLKPAWEPIVMAMKPLDGTFAENAHRYGVAGLNIDDSRIGVGKGGQRDGEKTATKRYADRGSTNFAPTPGPRGGDAKGRWPANLLLDEESGEMLDWQSGERPGCKSRSNAKPKSKFRPDQGEYMPQGPIYPDTGGASRFFYCSKANKRDRTCDGQVENKHPTVKPRSLMEYLCRLVTPPGGGLILDPFMGSGSTGIGALSTGNRFIGIELEPESFETARQRIETI